jgi:hypothetical protein
MLRGQISHEIDDLNILNKHYFWIPNEFMIRPAPDVLIKKFEFNHLLNEKKINIKDFIVNDLFQNTKEEWLFIESLFRYNIDKRANHYVLWNTMVDFSCEFDSEIMSLIIEDEIKKIVGHNNFDFAWYKNPKPNVPEYYHLQVFWIDYNKISKL